MQTEFAAALDVETYLVQWEQGAAKQLLKIVERHPEVLVEVAA